MKARFLGVAALAVTTMLTSQVPASAQETLTIASWGGAYQKAQREAWFDVVEKELGIKIKEDTTSGIADVRAQVASGSPTWDLVQQGGYSCPILQNEGIVEKLSPEILAIKGIPEEMKGEAWIGNIAYATVIAWNAEKYGDKAPASWADFWDTKNFPGPRSLRRSPVYTLESALLADGVEIDKLYPLDVDRAFKKLEEIKDDVAVWWSSGAQSAQLLKDGEVDMVAIWNGRADAIANEGAPVKLTYEQEMILADCWVVPKGAKNKELAMKAIEIMSRPDVQARLPMIINYGPVNQDAFEFIPKEVAEKLPNSPANSKNSFVLDNNWWAQNLDEVTKRFDLFIQE
jgi:putative spermidine/putrescine transport system substrate-binding protein